MEKRKKKSSNKERAVYERRQREFVKRVDINFSRGDEELEVAANILLDLPQLESFCEEELFGEPRNSPEIRSVVKALFEARRRELGAVIEIVAGLVEGETDLESIFEQSIDKTTEV